MATLPLLMKTPLIILSRSQKDKQKNMKVGREQGALLVLGDKREGWRFIWSKCITFMNGIFIWLLTAVRTTTSHWILIQGFKSSLEQIWCLLAHLVHYTLNLTSLYTVFANIAYISYVLFLFFEVHRGLTQFSLITGMCQPWLCQTTFTSEEDNYPKPTVKFQKKHLNFTVRKLFCI